MTVPIDAPIHVLIVAPNLAGDLDDQTANLVALAAAYDPSHVVLTAVTPVAPGESTKLARRLQKLTVARDDPSQQKSAEKIAIFEGQWGHAKARLFALEHDVFSDMASEETAPNYFAKAVLQLVADYRLEPDIVQAHGWLTAPLFTIWRERAKTAQTPAPKFIFCESTPESSALAKALPVDAIVAPCISAANTLADRIPNGSEPRPQVIGMTPGIDYTSWSSETDTDLVANYQQGKWSNKQVCKLALAESLGFVNQPNVPLVVAIGPFDESSIFSVSSELGVNLAFIGSSTPDFINALGEGTTQTPRNAVITNDAPPLRRLLSGADALLVLPQFADAQADLVLKAMRFGTIPIAPLKGFCGDTLVDFDAHSATGTGLLYDPSLEGEPTLALTRLATMYTDEMIWRTLMKNIMSQDFSATAAAKQFERLYIALHDNT